jgi:hypothetical protein
VQRGCSQDGQAESREQQANRKHHQSCLQYEAMPTGFTALATVPLDPLGVGLKPGRRIASDLGCLFDNATGTRTAASAYWCNNGFGANVTQEVPSESRFEPVPWGEASVE